VALHDFRGKAVATAVIYTACADERFVGLGFSDHGCAGKMPCGLISELPDARLAALLEEEAPADLRMLGHLRANRGHPSGARRPQQAHQVNRLGLVGRTAAVRSD